MTTTTKTTDMGWKDHGLWQYTSYPEPLLSAELARLSSAQSIAGTDCVSFQPCPNPEESSQDRWVIQDWDLPDGKWQLRGIFDGHAGHETADYVVETLPGIIKASLSALLDTTRTSESAGTAAPTSPLPTPSPPPAADVAALLQAAISKLDNDITQELLELFPSAEVVATQDEVWVDILINDRGGEPDEETRERKTKNLATVTKCMRGSTVLVSLVDPSRKNLWVASLGDCQAVLGLKQAGKWRTSILSSNHNGMNVEESERVQREHPDEDECMLEDRVLGALAVTRAIGDHLFKLPSIYTERIFMKAQSPFRFSRRVEEFLSRNHTPPYVSNEADVQHVDLSVNDIEGAFLIMCSDGLMDLGEDEVHEVELSDLARRWVDHVAKVPAGENLALSLLKENLGGDDLERVSRMISVEMTFRWMDDTTILVQGL